MNKLKQFIVHRSSFVHTVAAAAPISPFQSRI